MEPRLPDNLGPTVVEFFSFPKSPFPLEVYRYTPGSVPLARWRQEPQRNVHASGVPRPSPSLVGPVGEPALKEPRRLPLPTSS